MPYLDLLPAAVVIERLVSVSDLCSRSPASKPEGSLDMRRKPLVECWIMEFSKRSRSSEFLTMTFMYLSVPPGAGSSYAASSTIKY